MKLLKSNKKSWTKTGLLEQLKSLKEGIFLCSGRFFLVKYYSFNQSTNFLHIFYSRVGFKKCFCEMRLDLMELKNDSISITDAFRCMATLFEQRGSHDLPTQAHG